MTIPIIRMEPRRSSSSCWHTAASRSVLMQRARGRTGRRKSGNISVRTGRSIHTIAYLTILILYVLWGGTTTIPRKTSTRDTSLRKTALFWPGTAGDLITMSSPRTDTGTGESSRKRTNITDISGYPITIRRCKTSRRFLLTRATSARATMCSSTIMRLATT